MQVVQGNFFYHSNSRLGADGGLKTERQLLVEEQKSCTSRARKFSLETKRRRKALEERRRQWDLQEQKLIESILKQRRQRLQDATERFQRAHLPPSQRHRQSFRRNVPTIEEALNQIQGPLSSHSRKSAFLSSNSNISRSCTPSPKPPTVSKSSHRQALTAVEAYTKLLQEQSMTCFKSSQQAEKRREEKQQEHSPQDSQVSDCCISESLSSKDSLENEDPNHSTKNLQYSYSSLFLDSEKPHADLRKQNDLCPTSDLTSISVMMLLGENLPLSRKLHELKQKKQEDSEGPVSKASWGFTSTEQTASAGPEHFEANSSQNSPSDNVSVTDGAAPCNTALESSRPKKEALLDLRQKGVHEERPLKHPSATEILLPGKNGKDILFRAPRKNDIFLNNSTTDDASQEGKEIHYLSSQKELSASTNNLNKVSNLEPKPEKPINAESMQHASLYNIQSDTLKCLKHPEEEVQKLPGSVRKSHSVCEVRFIKGILKKPSKYMTGDGACLYGSGPLNFAKQVALAIRDSVELTKTKTKDAEGNNAVKKKLRWFDEVQEDKQDIMKQMSGKSSNQSEDPQLSLTTVSGASKPGPDPTPPASAGYHFAKQAWAGVGVQVSSPQERANEVKVPRSSSTVTGGPKVPQRERAAGAGAAPVSSRGRKCAVIRPKSATEVSQIAKAQGKMMAPRPPPRTEEKTAKAPCGANHAAEQGLHKDNSESLLSPYTYNVIRTDTYTPLPPSYTYNTKGPPSSGHQVAQGGSRRRGLVYNEKGLTRSPTDEEISQLWSGIRSALATKDAKNVFRRQVVDSSGRAVRKPCVEPSRPPPPDPGNRRLPQPPQPTKQTTEPVQNFSSLASAAQLHLAELHAGGLLEETDIVAAMETAQTQRTGTVQQHGQQQGHTTFSLEEQKILLSLERLNHQLYCVRGNTGTCGLVLLDAPSTREVKVMKQRASSANNRSRYQKKF